MSRRLIVASWAASAAVAFGIWASAADAAFTQCPAVGLDSSCQFLITVTDAGASLQQDSTQPAYDGNLDSLIGIQNSSSRPVQSVSLFAPGGLLFEFDGDGLCNSGHGPAPAGCQAPPGSSASCNPSTVNTNHCSFPPPPGEPPNYTEPGATNYSEETPPNTAVPPPWPNGDLQNGYEGPRNWFSNISADKNSGVVNFSPPLAPGESTYFSLEKPTQSVTAVVNVPTVATAPGTAPTVASATATMTTLAGDGLSGAILTVPQGALVTDTAHITGARTASAGGTVNYAVYRDRACTMLAGARSSATVTHGTAGASAPLRFGPGTYYPVATYNGEAVNSPSASKCGAEVLTVAHAWNANLPSARVCLKSRLRFQLRKPKGVRAGTVHIDIDGNQVRQLTVSGRRRPLVVLRKLPSGSFHVEVILTSRNGSTYEQSRLYRRCGK
jgi:hypothetical protein